MSMLRRIKARCIYWKEQHLFWKHSDSLVARGGATGVILSVTSISPRLHTLHLPIHRALRYGWRPDQVEIWLDHALQNIRSAGLDRLRQRGCRINFVEDVGPHTKLVYCMQKHPRASIITIDDDIWLPEGACKALCRGAERFPNAVICNRARSIPVDVLEQSYSQWSNLCEAKEYPVMNLLPLGCGGVLYPPGCLDKRFADKSLFRRLCPTGDDLWFTAMRMLNGRHAFHTGFVRGRELPVPGSRRHCLKRRHGIDGNNDASIKALFREYPLQAILLQSQN